MTRVAHVGPPLAHQGGPAGYLLQLSRAMREASGHTDDVLLPAPAPPQSPRTVSRFSLRRPLGRLKRRILGPPRFPRPSDASLKTAGGLIEAMVQESSDSAIFMARESLARAAGRPVIFCHESPVAEHVLAHRDPGQQVWLMLHSPMPQSLYLAWNWGVPERDWRDVITFPDVRSRVAWETGIWRQVDRLILPCREALDELVRIEPSVADIQTPISWVLSGASSASPKSAKPQADLRRSFGLPLDTRLGLFLGNRLAYRGLDALLAAVPVVDRSVPGMIVVAGPDPDAIPSHGRLLGLGHVADVGGLLGAVDFVINVNRFSLFDLSTIEALEAGRPLLLHGVGGNRTFRHLGAGVVVLDDLEPATIAAGLQRMFELSAADLTALGQASRDCYDRHLTLDAFWKRHRDLYEAHCPAVAS